MIESLLVMGVTWLLATAIGWVVTGLVDAPRRDALRPVAPLVGLAVTVLLLRWTSLAVGVDVGVWIVLGVVVLVAALATRRDRRWWRAPLRMLAWTVGVGAAAVIPAVITFGPTHAVGDSRVVQLSNNNDAFYYVSTADWLAIHPATDIPDRTSDPAATDSPPSYFPARSQLLGHLRIGQELTTAAVNVVLDRPAIDTWYPLTSLWVLLLPTAGYGVAVALRMRRLAGVGAGLATSVSVVTVLQFTAQNSDALLGLALMPLAVMAVVSSIGGRPTVPRWLAALLFVGAVGTYTEYLPLVVPGLAVALLVRRPSALRAALRRLPLLLLTAALAGPIIWYDAVRSLLYLGGLASPGFRSAFNQVGSGVVLNRFVGTQTVLAAYAPQFMTPVLVGVLGVGVVGALAVSRRRWFVLTVVAWPPLLAYYLVEVADPAAAYTQQRVVGLYVPLLLVLAAFGWDRLLDVIARVTHSRTGAARTLPRVVAALVAVVGLLSWGVVNGRSDVRQGLPAVALRRHVDPTFSQAAGWVAALGGPGGRDVDVIATEFFNQLWVTDALRAETEVEYPRLFVSYQGVQSFWSGRTRRYLLVDRYTRVDANAGLIVRSNARFVLLDLDRGPLAMLTPGDEFGIGNWFLLADPDVPSTVTLRGRTRPDPRRPLRPGTQMGPQLAAGTVTPTTTAITFTVPPGTGRLVNLIQNGLEFTPAQISVDPERP